MQTGQMAARQGETLACEACQSRCEHAKAAARRYRMPKQQLAALACALAAARRPRTRTSSSAPLVTTAEHLADTLSAQRQGERSRAPELAYEGAPNGVPGPRAAAKQQRRAVTALQAYLAAAKAAAAMCGHAAAVCAGVLRCRSLAAALWQPRHWTRTRVADEQQLDLQAARASATAAAARQATGTAGAPGSRSVGSASWLAGG